VLLRLVAAVIDSPVSLLAKLNLWFEVLEVVCRSMGELLEVSLVLEVSAEA
jgi:hypothetical protein